MSNISINRENMEEFIEELAIDLCDFARLEWGARYEAEKLIKKNIELYLTAVGEE